MVVEIVDIDGKKKIIVVLTYTCMYVLNQTWFIISKSNL